MGEDWQSVLKRLPRDWEEQAITLKAWQRLRKLACVGDLLRALLVYAACGFSFRQLGLWATLVGVGCLSERAWRKRVERAQEWIRWLLGSLIGSQQSPDWLPKTAGRVWLIDASRVKMPAGSGEDVKMHSAYNLGTGRLEAVEVSDRHSAEGLHHFALRQGDVVVTDAGYQLGTSVQQGQAEASLRSASVQQPSGAPGAGRWPEDRAEATDQASEVWHCEGVQGLGLGSQPHRALCASSGDLAAAPQTGECRARARKQARIRLKKGSKANLAPAWWAGVMLLGTTLPQESWSPQDVVKLYRARWQIEVLFKRLKQGLQLHLLPVKLWERAQAYVLDFVQIWEERRSRTFVVR